MACQRPDGEEAVPEMGQPSSFREHEPFYKHLVNSLVSSSRHADDIYRELTLAMTELPAEGRSRVKRIITNCMRKAITMRDTHQQLAHLVRGEDLETRNLRLTREAEIYLMLKRMQQDIRSRVPMFVSVESSELICCTIEDIMKYIREDNSVN